MPFDPAVCKMIADYGVAIVGLVFLTRFLMWLIKYILERNKQREDVIMNMLTADVKHLTDSLSNLTINMTNFSNAVNEAHRYQREEHKDLSDAHSAMITTLKEVTITLGRINGYTHIGPKGDKGDRGVSG